MGSRTEYVAKCERAVAAAAAKIFVATGRDVYLAQIDTEHWTLHRPTICEATGERRTLTVAYIREVRDEAEYAISYPVPVCPNNLRGLRTYKHVGTLTAAIARVRKAANR